MCRADKVESDHDPDPPASTASIHETYLGSIA